MTRSYGLKPKRSGGSKRGLPHGRIPNSKRPK